MTLDVFADHYPDWELKNEKMKNEWKENQVSQGGKTGSSSMQLRPKMGNPSFSLNCFLHCWPTFPSEWFFTSEISRFLHFCLILQDYAMAMPGSLSPPWDTSGSARDPSARRSTPPPEPYLSLARIPSHWPFQLAKHSNKKSVSNASIALMQLVNAQATTSGKPRLEGRTNQALEIVLLFQLSTAQSSGTAPKDLGRSDATRK